MNSLGVIREYSMQLDMDLKGSTTKQLEEKILKNNIGSGIFYVKKIIPDKAVCTIIGPFNNKKMDSNSYHIKH